jgi:HipA-like C-terminal domain
MPDPYPIVQLLVDSPQVIEQLGSKPKFWFRMEGDDQPWLFKFSREGTGEDWAEKIAAELAVKLQIPAARVDLAMSDDRRGSISRSFVRREEGWGLVHGDELLAGCVHGYRRDQVFHLGDHTLDNILLVLKKLFPVAEQYQFQVQQLAGYLVLDALVGNVDRHHQNWGILRRSQADGKVEEILAPTFDHASSLGRNAPTEERARRLQDGSVGAYVRRGKGGIFLATSDRHGANPLELVRNAATRLPEAFQPWLSRVRVLPTDEIRGIIDAVPEGLMDPIAKRFALAFVEYTRTQLCTP